MLRFELPLILLAIPLFIGILYYLTKPRSIISFCLRALIIMLLAFIVAGFRIKAPPQNLCRIYLIDDSASVFLDENRLLTAIDDNIKQLDNNDKWERIYFGRTPVYENRQPWNKHLNQPVDASGTNIERALSYAMGFFYSGYYREIFLFSDGNQTEGDARKVIPYLKQGGITLYTIPIGLTEVRDIKIDSVEAPKMVKEGQPIELKCRVSSTANITADIQVYSNGKLLGKLDRVSLLKNQDNAIVITLPAQAEPIETYEIKISAQVSNEIIPENNVWKEVIQKTGKPKIAYVSEAEDLSLRTLLSIIKSNNDFEITEQVDISSIKLYDIVILDNLPLADIPFMDGIRSFVSNGGGLLVVGGQNSFGLGNYQNSELEKILPVYASPPEDLSLVIIQDASGSMDEPSGITGKNKFHVASEALEDSVVLLSKIDRLEVMVFNQGYETILPLQNADNIIPKLRKSIAKVKPTGPTAIIPPLKKAMDTLSNISSAKKHIILLSDGHSTANEPLDGFKQMAEKLQQNNITISVIATGEHINEETLKALTRDSGLGKIYRLNSRDKDSLTKNLKEDLLVNKEFYRERKDLPASALIKDDILKGIDSIPQISGYNRTTLKPNARLVAFFSGGESLIADWKYGLGRVMVLTTSLDSHWIGGWEKWDRLEQMITQSLRYLTADVDNNQLSDISTEALADNRIKLKIEASDNLELIAQVEPLSEKITDTKTIPLSQVAVGKYEAVLPPQEGVIISIFSRKEGSKQLLGRVPVVAQYAKEWRRFTPDIGFLRDIAESINGKIITADEFAKGDTHSAVNNKSEPTYRNINSILILAALGIFLADLLLRR